MDALRFGRFVRVVRLRTGLRQRDVADRAGTGRSTAWRIEHGRLDEVTWSAIKRLCDVLEIRVELIPSWRGFEGARLFDREHAATVELLVRDLTELGWGDDCRVQLQPLWRPGLSRHRGLASRRPRLAAHRGQDRNRRRAGRSRLHGSQGAGRTAADRARAGLGSVERQQAIGREGEPGRSNDDRAAPRDVCLRAPGSDDCLPTLAPPAGWTLGGSHVLGRCPPDGPYAKEGRCSTGTSGARPNIPARANCASGSRWARGTLLGLNSCQRPVRRAFANSVGRRA